MPLRFVFAATLIALSTPATADDKNGVFTVLQLGTSSCGSFSTAADKGNNQDNWADWNRYFSYAMGYFTGINTYERNTRNILGNTDGNGVMANVEKFCRENPLKTFYNALDATAVELYQNRRK